MHRFRMTSSQLEIKPTGQISISIWDQFTRRREQKKEEEENELRKLRKNFRCTARDMSRGCLKNRNEMKLKMHDDDSKCAFISITQIEMEWKLSRNVDNRWAEEEGDWVKLLLNSNKRMNGWFGKQLSGDDFFSFTAKLDGKREKESFLGSSLSLW